MKLVAVLVAFGALLSGGFQTTASLRAGVFTSGLQAPVAFVADPTNPDVFYAVEQGGRIRVARLPMSRVARAIESVRERIGIGNKRGDQGVKAEVKGHEVAISVTIMVEFGHVVLEVARNVQVNVARKTHRMLGLKVLEVNVTVDDVRTATADEPDEHVADEAAPVG